ncbi:MAG: FHA domain-containing protein, partial [Bifidobacteriaceae bacterium]|jgi:hypothetical protein|nr:FHA domain-containing protein [Bifidobacteriaceae bacterium]
MVLTAMVKLSVSDRVEDEDRPVDGPGESAESADRATPAAGAGLDGAGGAGTGIGGPVQGALPHTPDGAAPQGQSVETIAPGPTLLGNLYGQAPEPDPFPSPAVPEHDSYDHLFDAATVRDGVESAAVRPVSGEGEAEGQASASSVPEASPQDDDYDPDGVTIKGLGPGRAMARSFSAPQGAYVLGRVCVCGVANPPRRTECSSCGAPLTGDAVSVSRPALGYALVTPGERYELTRPLILGRRPRSARFGPQNTPILVTVPSPSQDISRSHLGIELEDWSVLVVDLGATNSTILRRAGVADRRLNSKEQVLAKNGDVYDLGDGVTVAIGGIP